MMVLRSVGVFSVGKCLGCLYALLGLLVGGIFSLFSLLGFAAAGGDGGIIALVTGIGAIIILPIFYGVIGFIGGMIAAALYNVIASMMGGIEIELEGPFKPGQR